MSEIEIYLPNLIYSINATSETTKIQDIKDIRDLQNTKFWLNSIE